MVSLWLKQGLTRHQMVLYSKLTTRHRWVSLLDLQIRGSVILDGTRPIRDVYDAVADPTRRKLLQMLSDAEELPLHELTVHFQMGRTAVSKHLAILKDADLVIARRVGRETRYRLNATPLREIQDWVSFYEGFWKERMVKLNLLLEEKKWNQMYH